MIDQTGEAHERAPLDQLTLSDHIANLKINSWASVAAKPTSKGNRLIVHQPSSKPPNSNTPQVSGDGDFVAPSEARVVWVRPTDSNINIDTKMVAKVITQGPLYSVAYSSKDHGVCVIFHNPDHARAFLDASTQAKRKDGYGLLGSFYEVFPGHGYSNTEELKRMEFPKNERRRLTFVRSALFTEGMTEARFTTDLYRMVGEEHVELVWLFNSGNGKKPRRSGVM